MFYPGRVYTATPDTEVRAFGGPGHYHRATLPGMPGHPPARREGDRGAVDMDATEIVSMGVEWLWTDPAGFAATDPEYFDFVWDTVVWGIR